MKENIPAVYLVIFQTSIGGQLAQVEVTANKNPMNSRQVRRDCENTARTAFAKLDKRFWSGQAIKCVECVEFQPPQASGY